MNKHIAAAFLAASLALGSAPAMAQYVQVPQAAVVVPQDELYRLSGSVSETVGSVGTVRYGERVEHLTHRMLELGQAGVNTVSSALGQIAAQQPYLRAACAQVGSDVNRIAAARTAAAPTVYGSLQLLPPIVIEEEHFHHEHDWREHDHDHDHDHWR
jgi:hypothetical protein